MDPPVFEAERDTTVIAFTKVKLPWGWLGNMSGHSVMFNGLRWPTAEALFQALRFAADDPVREAIRIQKSPMSAKMTAKAHRDRMAIAPQSAEDLDLMRAVVRLKLEQHMVNEEFARQVRILRSYSSALIIEDCSKRTHGSGLFWGAQHLGGDCWKGHNYLGRIWMELLFPR